MQALNQLLGKIILTKPEATAPSAPNQVARSSAVMVTLFRNNQSILLCQRQPWLRRHAGQICLPGGMYEEQDIDLLTTALRETDEETGLKLDKQQVIGQLSATQTINQTQIQPFIAVTDTLPTQLNASPDEVAELIFLPLEYCLRPSNWAFSNIKVAGQRHRIPYLIWQQRCIWGATARICHQLSKIYSR